MRHVLCIAATILLAITAVLGEEVDSLKSDTSGTRSAAPKPVADTSGYSVDASPFVIRVGQIRVDDMRLHDTIEVTLNSHGREIGGFDLKIGVDDPRIDILDVIPGRMYDSCRWEYFSARRMEGPVREGQPRAVWQVVALSQMMPDTVQPLCFGTDEDLPVIGLVVSNEHVPMTDDGVVPIFFYWEDCTDNSIADRTGNQQVISRRVYDYTGRLPEASAPLFPSRFGAPVQCVNPAVRNPMKRLIDFHNGSVEFRLNLGAPPDSTGADSSLPGVIR